MKAWLREGRHRRSFGLFIERVVVAAERESPEVALGRPAAGARKIVPGNTAFDGPALITIGAVIERAAANHGGLPVKFTIAFGLLERNALPLEIDVEHRAGCIDLELVVRRLVLVRAKEQLEYIVQPSSVV